MYIYIFASRFRYGSVKELVVLVWGLLMRDPNYVGCMLGALVFSNPM